MDDIDLTKGRQEKFQNDQCTKKDLLRNRENKMLQLRKAGVNDRIQKSRNYQKIDDSSKFEIKIENLVIGNDLVDNYYKSNDKVEEIFKMLDNNEVNIQKFAIKQLNYLSDALEDNSSLLQTFKPDYYNKILKYLFQTNDINEIYELTLILINLTRCSSEVVEYIAQPNILCPLFDKMELTLDYLLINHFIIIFGNLLGESKRISEAILSKCNIIHATAKYMNSTNVPLYLKTSLFFLISNICKHLDIKDIRDNYLPFLPTFANNLKSSIDSEHLTYTLMLVKEIIAKSTKEDLEYILSNKVHLLILPHIKQGIKKENVDLIFRILTSITNVHVFDKFVDDLYVNNIFGIIEEYLECLNFSSVDKKDSNLVCSLTSFLDALVNVIEETLKSKLIRRTKIPILLIRLIEHTSNLSTVFNILSFFKISLDTNQMNTKTDLLRIPLLETFCKHLRSGDFEIQLVCLEGIYLLLEYAENLMKNKRNILLTQLELNGEIYNIKNLISSKNESLSKLAEEICTKYFKESEEVENA